MQLLTVVRITGLIWCATLAFGQELTTNASVKSLIADGGFEQPVSRNWYLNPALNDRGIAGNSVFGRAAGRYSLRLVPNSRNQSGLAGGEYGFAQNFPVQDVVGKQLYFSGHMMSSGGSTAVLRVIAIRADGQIFYRELRQGSNSTVPVFRREVLDIPLFSSIVSVFLMCSVQYRQYV